MTNQEFAQYVGRALAALRPGAHWAINDDHQYEDIVWNDVDTTIPSKADVTTKIEELIALDVSLQYQKDRAPNYPLLEQQLDMLYHDIKSGNLESGSWITAIEAIKSQYPKPQGV